MIQPWLLQPGDPLPPLWTDRGLLTPEPGQWLVIAVAPAEQIQAASKTMPSTPCVTVSWPQGSEGYSDPEGAVARALGLWTGSGCLPGVVAVEPRGTVAGAWSGPDLASALAQAATALGGWRKEP